MNDRMEELLIVEIEAEEKAAANARTETERQVKQRMAESFRGANGRINWGDFDRSWNLFLTGGYDQLWNGNARVAGMLPAGVTIDQLRNTKEADGTSLYDKLNQEMLEKMGRLRMSRPSRGLLGGMQGPQGLTQDEIINLRDRINPKAIDTLLKERKDLRDQIDKALGEGALSGDWLRRFPWRQTALVLGIIFGIGLAVTTGAVRTP